MKVASAESKKNDVHKHNCYASGPARIYVQIAVPFAVDC